MDSPTYVHFTKNELDGIYAMASERLMNTTNEIKRIRQRNEKLGRGEDSRIPALIEYRNLYRDILFKTMHAQEAYSSEAPSIPMFDSIGDKA